jgi:hypothetical protein
MTRRILSAASARARLTRTIAVALLALGSAAGTAHAATLLTWVRSARAYAFATNRHALYVGLSDDYVVMRGDGDTDLDCWLYNRSGELVASDTRPTDVCMLAAPDVGTHTLVVRNLGEVYNDYLVGKH